MICFFKFPLQDTLGGAEFHTLQLAKHFLNQGKGVKLFTSDRKLLHLFQTNCLSAEFLFCGWEPTSKIALLLWPLTFLIARKKFKKLLRDVPAESVFFMQSLTEKLILTSLLQVPSSKIQDSSSKLQAKAIWLEHKIPGRWLRLNPLKFRYLRLARQILLITVSHFAKQKFVELGVPENRIQVVYPSVYNPPQPSLILREGGLRIGVLSRLDPEKGVLNFLKNIIPHLPDHLYWKILIAGEGKDKNKIKQLIDDHSLKNQIQMLGFVNDLEFFFSQISVLVYPTKVAESFGLSILEALAKGVPTVATNIGAIPEIIKHGENGFLVEKQKSNWVDYLEELQDPELYEKFSANAFRTAERFSEKILFYNFNHLIFTKRSIE